MATSGSKTFDLSFRIKGGLARRMSLGRFPEISLDKARDRANELTKAGRAGRDLGLEERDSAAESAKRITVSALIEQYVAREVRGKLKTAKEIENRLKRALAPKLDQAAESLRRREIRELFDLAADAGLEREAEKRRQTVGAMFRWAVARDLVDIDPTAGLTAYDSGKPRDRVLSWDEIASVWAWLDSSDFPALHSDVLRLQLLTGARCGEAAGILPDEINSQDWTWTLPAGRSKNGQARITPLVGLAREIIGQRLAPGSPLFPSESGRPLTASHVGHALLHRSNRLPIAPFTTHDMRRTFATALDGMGISLDLIASIVGHELAATRETRTLVRHYVRTDKLERKRAALQAWDQRLREIVAGEHKPDQNVVSIRQTG